MPRMLVDIDYYPACTASLDGWPFMDTYADRDDVHAAFRAMSGPPRLGDVFHVDTSKGTHLWEGFSHESSFIQEVVKNVIIAHNGQVYVALGKADGSVEIVFSPKPAASFRGMARQFKVVSQEIPPPDGLKWTMDDLAKFEHVWPMEGA